MIQEKPPESGFTALETALFLPLFLFFVFIVTDAGLAFVERAAFTNRLRASLQSETLKTKSDSLLVIDSTLELSLNPNAGQLLQELASDIFGSLLDVQVSMSGQASNSVSLTLSLVTATIDQQTGELISYSVPESVTLPANIHNPSLPQFNPEFHYVTRENYLDNELSVGSGIAPSRYAIATGPSYDQSGQGTMHYALTTALLYAEVTAVTRGVNPGFVRQTLGDFYSLQNQQLAIIRSQVR